MRYQLIIFLVLCFLLACHQKKINFSINGNIDNGVNKKIYLKKLGQEKDSIVDSLKISDDGSFSFSGYTDNKSFFSLSLSNDESVNLIVSPGDDIRIKGQWGDFSDSYNVAGSRESECLEMIHDKMNSYYKTVDSLGKIFRHKRDSVEYQALKSELDSAFYNSFNKAKNELIGFIKSNPGSFASMVALYQQRDLRNYMIDWEKNYNLIKKIDSILYQKHPESDAVIVFHEQVNELKKKISLRREKEKLLQKGKKAPEISLPGTSGETVDLSSLQGKYVLLDFWASWCAPCRRENPELLEVYNRFSDKGFEIFQVSLDRDKRAWMKAIEEDSLPWINVSDLKMWNSVVVPNYNISQIPTNYLLDKKGRIIKKDVEISELDSLLTQFLN